MYSTHDMNAAGEAAAVSQRGRHGLRAAVRVLALAGYGIWILQGLGLALGLARSGRGETLVPLAAGLVFVGVGLLLASLRRPWTPAWHGWRPGYSSWPNRAALMALATFLPLLAVAGLTRGDNSFWLTRVAGAVLAACTIATVVCSRLAKSPGSGSGAALPLERLALALYAGGLWQWAFAAADSGGSEAGGAGSWVALLGLGLLLVLAESMRWRLFTAPVGKRAGWRLLAALLAFALPCAALLLGDRVQADAALIALALAAAIGGVAGKALEQALYRGACPVVVDGAN